LRAFPGLQENPAISFKFSPDAHWVAATFQDGHAEVRAVDVPRETMTFPGHPVIRTVVEFLPDNHSVIVASQPEGLFSLDLVNSARRALMAPPADCTAMALDKLGERVSVLVHKAVHVIQIADGSIVWSKPLTATWADWSPDGRQLALATGEPYFDV